MREPPEAVTSLDPLTRQLYAVLDVGTHDAKDFFEGAVRPFSSALYPGLVRYFAKKRWDEFALGRDAQDLLDFRRVDLPNDGLGFRNRDFYVRVWKADEGDLPPPGNSLSKREFLAQGTLFATDRWTQIPLADADPAWGNPAPLNLVLLWDVDAHHLLSTVAFICTEGDDTGHYQEAWRVPIAHPGEATRLEPAPVEAAECLDLEMSLRDADDEIAATQEREIA